MWSTLNLELAQSLVEVIRFFNSKGWSPATSTNYSVRSEKNDEYIMSRSGVDKAIFSLDDLILINSNGKIIFPLERIGLRPSAEMEIHTALYERFPEINCVLHTHSLLGTVLSHHFQKQKQMIFEGLEILKGLEGNSTHEMTEVLPIVANSQLMSEIIGQLDAHFRECPKLHGFLIAGHGLYTWGKDLHEAKRHVETFEFLFECFHTKRSL